MNEYTISYKKLNFQGRTTLSKEEFKSKLKEGAKITKWVEND